MIKVSIPAQYDIRVELLDATTFEFPCDAEYSHEVYINSKSPVDKVFVKYFLTDLWIEVISGQFTTEVTNLEERQGNVAVDTVESPYKLKPEEACIKEDMVRPTMCDGAQDQAIEPENIDKLEGDFTPFVKAQLSTKNQMILRNILAILSSVGVVIAFILEKLGIM